MTKAEINLAKKIVADHYVELTSKSKQKAAMALDDLGLVRIFTDDADALWVKARTRFAYETLEELADDA
jgi:hypothetical protein